MNWRGFAAGFALTLPLTVVGVADAAPTVPATFTHVSGDTYGEPLVFDYTVGKRVDRAHALIACDNDADGTWEYAEATYVASPGEGTVTFGSGVPGVWSPWDNSPGDAVCTVGLYRWTKQGRLDYREPLAPVLTINVDDPR